MFIHCSFIVMCETIDLGRKADDFEMAVTKPMHFRRWVFFCFVLVLNMFSVTRCRSPTFYRKNMCTCGQKSLSGWY